MAYAVQALTHYQTYPEKPPGADLPPQKLCNMGPMAPCAEKRTAGSYRELRDTEERTALAISLIQDTEQVKRARNSERYVTRSLLGYEESDEARAERAEAKVRELERENAELRERNGKLEGKVEVFERLFSIVEARPKQ